MRKVVCICGQIRNRQILTASLNFFIKAREKGIIDNIIISTWTGEIEKYHGLSVELNNARIQLFQQDYPQMPADGNQFCQKITLRCILDFLADDDLVLRTRADILFNDFSLEKIFDTVFSSEISNSFGIRNKIWVPSFEMYTPFFISDYTYCGSAFDLKKLGDGLHFFNPHEARFFDKKGALITNEMPKSTLLQVGWPVGAMRMSEPVCEQRLFLPMFKNICSIAQEIEDIMHLFSAATNLRPFKYDILLNSNLYWEYIFFYWCLMINVFIVGSDAYDGNLLFYHSRDLNKGNLFGYDIMSGHNMERLLSSKEKCIVERDRIRCGFVLLTSTKLLKKIIMDKTNCNLRYLDSISDVLNMKIDKNRKEKYIELKNKLNAIRHPGEKLMDPPEI